MKSKITTNARIPKKIHDALVILKKECTITSINDGIIKGLILLCKQEGFNFERDENE